MGRLTLRLTPDAMHKGFQCKCGATVQIPLYTNKDKSKITQIETCGGCRRQYYVEYFTWLEEINGKIAIHLDGAFATPWVL